MNIEEAIKEVSDLRKELGLFADRKKVKQGIAIDIVLNELDNRMPVSEIEKILEATKQLREKEIKELGMSLRGSAVDVLENILKNYKE